MGESELNNGVNVATHPRHQFLASAPPQFMPPHKPTRQHVTYIPRCHHSSQGGAHVSSPNWPLFTRPPPNQPDSMRHTFRDVIIHPGGGGHMCLAQTGPCSPPTNQTAYILRCHHSSQGGTCV